MRCDHCGHNPSFADMLAEQLVAHLPIWAEQHAHTTHMLRTILTNQETIMADLATLTADFDSFTADVKTHFQSLNDAQAASEASITDLKAKLAAGQTPDPAVQAAVDHVEAGIADVRSVMDGAPTVPSVPAPPADAPPADPTAPPVDGSVPATVTDPSAAPADGSTPAAPPAPGVGDPGTPANG